MNNSLKHLGFNPRKRSGQKDTKGKENLSERKNP